MRDHAEGRVGSVHIGTGATMAEFLLPQVCAEVMRGHSEVQIELSVALTDVLRDLLRVGRVDMILGPLLSTDRGEFEVEELGTDIVVVACGAGHPLAGRPVELRDLARSRWLLPPRSVQIRHWLDSIFTRAGLNPPAVAMQTSVVSWVKQLVNSTNLLTFTSRHDVTTGELVEIDCKAALMRRRIGVLRQRDAYLSPAGHLVLEALRRHTGQVFVNR